MSGDDAGDNGEAPPVTLNDDPDAEMRDFLRLIGFLDEEAAAIINDPEITSANMPFVAITRLAQRVAAMEAYLRAKIVHEGRGGRIVTPWQKN